MCFKRRLILPKKLFFMLEWPKAENPPISECKDHTYRSLLSIEVVNLNHAQEEVSEKQH